MSFSDYVEELSEDLEKGIIPAPYSNIKNRNQDEVTLVLKSLCRFTDTYYSEIDEFPSIESLFRKQYLGNKQNFFTPSEFLNITAKKEKLFDKVMSLVGFQDIDFEEFKVFSDKFLLIGHNETKVRAFFTSELVEFLSNEDIYHVESNGEALLIFKEIRLGHSSDVEKLHHFCEELIHIVCGNKI